MYTYTYTYTYYILYIYILYIYIYQIPVPVPYESQGSLYIYICVLSHLADAPFLKTSPLTYELCGDDCARLRHYKLTTWVKRSDGV